MELAGNIAVVPRLPTKLMDALHNAVADLYVRDSTLAVVLPRYSREQLRCRRQRSAKSRACGGGHNEAIVNAVGMLGGHRSIAGGCGTYPV